MISRSIRADDPNRFLDRMGQRPLLLSDNFPDNVDDRRALALALVLAPLRAREPELRDLVTAYLACPMQQLEESRIALSTVADFLRRLVDPGERTAAFSRITRLGPPSWRDDQQAHRRIDGFREGLESR